MSTANTQTTRPRHIKTVRPYRTVDGDVLPTGTKLKVSATPHSEPGWRWCEFRSQQEKIFGQVLYIELGPGEWE